MKATHRLNSEQSTRNALAFYVLVKDLAGNRLPHAQAPISAFAKSKGVTLAEVAQELLGDTP